MSYTLHKNLTTVNRTKGNSGRKYIVIHYTANKTDTAKANANYFKSTYRGASAHYFVDATTVYQSVDEDDTAWSVGKNFGSGNLFGVCKNSNSISIEMCGTGGKVSDATFANTVALTKKLMKKYGIPASRVVRHYDVCSKKCPGWTGWIPPDSSLWTKFRKKISGNSTTSSETKKTSSGSTYDGNFPVLPDKGYLAKGDTGTQVKRVQKFLNWYGSYGLSVDGSFGSKTVAAVKKFQKAEGLTVDGSFGKKTLAKAKTVKK